MKAVRVHNCGGPEVLTYDEIPVPEPKAGEARVKIDAIGLNFIDVYQRIGLYPLPTPFTLGMEGAGVVDAVGDGVTEVKKGDRVAYAMIPGSYGDYAIVPAAKLVPLPPNIDAKTAAGLMLQGMTAHYLTRSTYPLKRGETALIHAAAGGVGLLLVQAAKIAGARVIGTVSKRRRSSPEAGADVILYTQADFLAEVKRLTDGRGVDVVYDSVGAATRQELGCLRPAVIWCSSANQRPGGAGQPGTLVERLAFLTRPICALTLTRAELLERANDLFNWTATGKLKLRVERAYSEGRRRRKRQLEARKTTGKVILIP
jgi:NADPH2:quinone reductase